MDISVIILTYNEELHIQRCIKNVKPWVRDIYMVDCFSTDRTEEVVLQFESSKVLKLKSHTDITPSPVPRSPSPDSCAISFVQHPWPGTQAEQLNWALDNLPIRTKWVLRLDADEYLCPELIEEIKAKLDGLPDDVTGVEFNLRRVFMGRMIRRGIPNISMIRLFRYGKARCEQRLMDERIKLLAGREVTFDGAFVDHNLNDLSWWTQKHIGYAIREAANLLDLEYGLLAVGKQQSASGGGDNSRMDSNGHGREGDGAGLGAQAAAKRRMKMRYARAPLFWRAFAYFGVRYFVRGGFLEGKEGFMWHFFQGLWYRMLVDAKVWEIKRESGGEREKMLELLRGKYGLKI
jgi:glycosyltransferase involved in cell wall biosynthesis